MNKLNINAIAIAIGLAFSAGAMAQTMSKDQYKSGKNGIAAEYKSATAAAVAAKADAKTRMKTVTANYAVAKEKCDALAGDAKSNCVQQAMARFGKS